MLASLGLFVFDMKTLPFSERTRRRDWRHERSERFGQLDGAQFVGPGDDVLTIGGTLLPQVAGSFAAIDTLVDMADAGDTYQFVEGTGRVLGGFVITAIDERGSYIMVDGVQQKIDFAIDLRRVS